MLCIWQLVCKTGFVLLVCLLCMVQFTLWNDYPLPDPSPCSSSSSAFYQTQLTPEECCGSVRLGIDLNGSHDDYCTHTPQERGVACVLRAWRVSPAPCGAWQVWVNRTLWIPSGGGGQDVTASAYTHCPLLARRWLLLSGTGLWQEALNAIGSPGGPNTMSRDPITQYKYLCLDFLLLIKWETCSLETCW